MLKLVTMHAEVFLVSHNSQQNKKFYHKICLVQPFEIVWKIACAFY